MMQQNTPISSLSPDIPATSRGIRIAIYVCFLNAGISTRGLEIAKALRDLTENSGVTIRFFSWKGPTSITYDHIATNAGFDITYYGPEVDEGTWSKILEAEHSGRAAIQDKDFMVAHIEGAIQSMKDYSPDVVVHGLLPDASIAAQILDIPNVLYGPVPFWDNEWINANKMQDIPDAQTSWLTDLLPKWIRRKIMQYMSRLKQAKKFTIYEAAVECGWEPTGVRLSSIFGATHYLLTDLPSNYKNDKLGSNVHIIGPLFAGSSEERTVLPANIADLLGPDKENKVFVTLGSSGQKEAVVEAVKAVCAGKFNAVVALAPGRCRLADVHRSLDSTVIPDSVLLTEEFLPAYAIAPLVHVVIGHGGQGTVQTALASGTPIVGVAMQWEQQYNLDNAAKHGAGIRIPKRKWNADTILASVREVLTTESYKHAAVDMQKEISQAKSAMKAAQLILNVAQEGRNSVSKQVNCG